MKRILLFLISSILCLLSACTPSESLPRLDKPINLSVNKNVLTFDAVENADYYIINANSINYEVFDTTHTFLDAGVYTIRIRAVGQGYLSSPFSDEITVDIGFLSYPEGISIINNQLVYLPVEHATSYNINVDGEIYNTNESLPKYFGPGTYAVSIQALSNTHADSPYSPVVELAIDENTKLLTAHTYAYSEYSTFDLPLFTYLLGLVNTFEFERVTFDDKETQDPTDDEEIFTLIDSENLYISDNTVYLSAAYLASLYATESDIEIPLVFQLTTNQGDHRIVVHRTADQKPYMHTDKNIKTNFHDDVVFGFDEFDATFVAIYGPQLAEITLEDYTYEAGVLTISTAYVTRIFAANLNRNHIFLTYRFDSGSFTYFGLFSIRK